WNFDNSGTFSSGILAHSNDGWRASRWSEPQAAGGVGSGYDNFRVPDGPTSDSNCYNSTTAPTDSSDCNLRSLTFGKSGGTSSRIQENNTLVDDYSFNVKFTPNDKWEIIADFQYIDAQSSSSDMTINTGFWGLNYFDNSSSGVPRMALINPWDVVPDAGYNPENSAFYDTKGNLAALEAAQVAAGGLANAIDRDSPDYFTQPSSSWWNDLNGTYMRATGDEKAIRLDSAYFLEGGLFTAVKMGVRMSERQQEVRDVGYSNWGALSGMRDLDTVNGETGHAAAWLDLNDTPYEV